MNKIGVLYSGISFQHETLNNEDFRGLFIPISIYDLPETDLYLYDAIIIPRSVDQVALNDYKRIILEFLELPGLIVALGDYWGDWLPGCRMGGFTPEDDEPLEKIMDHPILSNLESPDLHWHKGLNGLCSHGHLIPPKGADILIRNKRNDAILYEDRVSTPGIIIAGSQFDLFCHCFSRDKGALTAMQNLLKWINTQVPEIRRKRTCHKIGVIYSGLHFHYNLFTRPEFEDIELIYIRRLSNIDLMKYNVLIIPRESNQELLCTAREKLIRFLDQGKTILSFGEVVLPWLPGLVWQKALPEVKLPKGANDRYERGNVYTDNLVIEEPEHNLFKGISIKDMQWHYHGVFSPQEGQKNLLSNGSGKSVILLDELSFKGTVLATTLDPEEHAGFGEVKITERFLAQCMEWARSESRKISKATNNEEN